MSIVEKKKGGQLIDVNFWRMCVYFKFRPSLYIPKKNPQNISGMLLVAWWAEIFWEYFFFQTVVQGADLGLIFSPLSLRISSASHGACSITSYLPLYIHTNSLFPSLTHVSRGFFCCSCAIYRPKNILSKRKKYDVPFRISRRFTEGLSSREVWYAVLSFSYFEFLARGYSCPRVR